MIGVLDRSTSTYDAIKIPAQGFRNLYTGLSKIIAAHNSTAIRYDLPDNTLIGQTDNVVTTGSYSITPFWILPVAPETPTFVKPKKLSLKQAQEIALKALTSAEERRQREREEEAKFWEDLD